MTHFDIWYPQMSGSAAVFAAVSLCLFLLTSPCLLLLAGVSETVFEVDVDLLDQNVTKLFVTGKVWFFVHSSLRIMLAYN